MSCVLDSNRFIQVDRRVPRTQAKNDFCYLESFFAHRALAAVLAIFLR